MVKFLRGGECGEEGARDGRLVREDVCGWLPVFGVWGLGCRVQGAGFRVEGLGVRVED